MLRLKRCIDDLRIKQQTIAVLTGWSKTQISITLNSGDFPKDAERFKSSMRAFVEVTPPVQDWLQERGLVVDDLFATVPDIAPLETNQQGEVRHHGPEWACSDYGLDGHDYQECRICMRKYEGWLAMERGRAVVMGGAA